MATGSTFPAWGWWVLGIFLAGVVAAIVVVVWLLTRNKGERKGERLHGGSEAWLHVPSSHIPSHLAVPQLSVVRVKSGNTHVHVETRAAEDGSIVARLLPVEGSPSAEEEGQKAKVTFRDELSGKGRTVKFALTGPEAWQWQELFKATSRPARVPRNHIPLDTPRRIMQTYRLPYLRTKMFRAHQSFARQNPGFATCFYGNRDMRRFVAQYFEPRVLAALDRLRPGAYKADLFRLCELYVNGGVYADVEMVCLAPLESLLHGVDLVVVRDSPFRDLSYLYNAFICAKPNLPFLRFAIDELVERVEKGEYSRDPLSVTGPGIFGRGLNRFVGRPEREAHGLGVFKYGDMRVRILDNTGTHVVDTERGGLKLISDFYEDWGGDRPGNPHYWALHTNRKVFLSRFVSENEEETKGQPLFQTSESSYMMEMQLRRVRNNSTMGTHVFADDQTRQENIEAIDQMLGLEGLLIKAYASLLSGGVRAHLWGVAAVLAYGGAYLDTHARLLVSANRAFPHNDDPVTAWVSFSGCWAASSSGHRFFVAALATALKHILEDKRSDTHSSLWFNEALNAEPGNDLVLMEQRDNMLKLTGMTVAEVTYDSYPKERVWSGGEDPKELAKRHHVLEPASRRQNKVSEAP